MRKAGSNVNVPFSKRMVKREVLNWFQVCTKRQALNSNEFVAKKCLTAVFKNKEDQRQYMEYQCHKKEREKRITISQVKFLNTVGFMKVLASLQCISRENYKASIESYFNRIIIEQYISSQALD